MHPSESEPEPSEPESPLWPASDECAPGGARSFAKRHPTVTGLAVGLLGASIVGVAVLIVMAMRDRPSRLTRERYEAAAARWDAEGPASYDLDVEISGRRSGEIHVEVRDGAVTRMTRDGVQPRQQRTWYYWSVPGQFDTIEQELDMAEDPVASYGAPSAAQVIMWAEFDPKYGYPRQFDRIVLGADLETHWKVTRFEAVGAKK